MKNTTIIQESAKVKVSESDLIWRLPEKQQSLFDYRAEEFNKRIIFSGTAPGNTIFDLFMTLTYSCVPGRDFLQVTLEKKIKYKN